MRARPAKGCIEKLKRRAVGADACSLSRYNAYMVTETPQMWESRSNEPAYFRALLLDHVAKTACCKQLQQALQDGSLLVHHVRSDEDV